MARVWICGCGWGRKDGKKAWIKDPACPGGHAHRAHSNPVQAKATGKPGKHREKK